MYINMRTCRNSKLINRSRLVRENINRNKAIKNTKQKRKQNQKKVYIYVIDFLIHANPPSGESLSLYLKRTVEFSLS